MCNFAQFESIHLSPNVFNVWQSGGSSSPGWRLFIATSPTFRVRTPGEIILGGAGEAIENHDGCTFLNIETAFRPVVLLLCSSILYDREVDMAYDPVHENWKIIKIKEMTDIAH